VVHRRWSITADAPIGSWLSAEDVMIADGHHRYATALAYRDEMRREAGPGPWDRLLVFLVDASSEQLEVRPFHRVQRSGPMVEGVTPVEDLDALMAALSDDAPVVGVVTGAADGHTLGVLPLPGEAPSVRALHREVLDGRVPGEELRFTPDAAEAVAAVRAGTAVGAYILPPTTPDRIRKVVEQGERLPQKSTYFWPKPRTGMTLMPLSDTSNP
jgi:uncharacterized protein (DUF1015 family)